MPALDKKIKGDRQLVLIEPSNMPDNTDSLTASSRGPHWYLTSSLKGDSQPVTLCPLALNRAALPICARQRWQHCLLALDRVGSTAHLHLTVAALAVPHHA